MVDTMLDAITMRVIWETSADFKKVNFMWKINNNNQLNHNFEVTFASIMVYSTIIWKSSEIIVNDIEEKVISFKWTWSVCFSVKIVTNVECLFSGKKNSRRTKMKQRLEQSDDWSYTKILLPFIWHLSSLNRHRYYVIQTSLICLKFKKSFWHAFLNKAESKVCDKETCNLAVRSMNYIIRELK